MFAALLDHADHACSRFGVPGIQNATHLLVFRKEAVGLVDQQRGMLCLDVPKDRGRADIGRQLRARGQIGEQDHDASLAAPLGRRCQTHDRRNFACVMRPRM